MMPQLGETVTEGTITRWMKGVGDAVERDEPLFEVSTDKVDSEVPSPAAGVLSEILVPEGETVEVGVKLAVIGDGAAAAPAQDAPAAVAAEARAGRRRPATTAAPSRTGPASAPTPGPRPGAGTLGREQRRRAEPVVAHGAQAVGRERDQRIRGDGHRLRWTHHPG